MRNEQMVAMRAYPMSYRATYNADNYIVYEGWSEVGAAEDSSAWIICIHEYDANNNEISMKWAGQGSYDKSWTNRATHTYN